MSAERVLARRRAERDRLLERARQFVAALDSRLAIRAAVVFGSVARGDFNRWSDIDLLLVADIIPTVDRDRIAAIGEWPPGVQPIVWTADEWRAARASGNPIAEESVRAGVWLTGSADDLDR